MSVIHHCSYEDALLLYDHATNDAPAPSQYAPHAHSRYELIFFRRGDASYTVDGRRYKLSRGQLILSRPFAVHEIGIESGAPYERYDILFDLSMLPGDVLAGIPAETDVLRFDGHPTVPAIFEKMDYYCGRLSGTSCGRTLAHLVEEVLVNAAIEAQSGACPALGQSHPMVAAAVAYIEQELTTLTGIDELCRALFITNSYLHRLFMQYLHVSPKKFITAKRLAMAQREICAGGKPTEVCFRCGFRDYSAFWRAYTAFFGCKPSDRSVPGHASVSEDTSPRYTP